MYFHRQSHPYNSPMKSQSFPSLAMFVAALLFQLGAAHAATVGPAGYTNDFGVQPPAVDWATASRPTAASDTYDPDTDVNATS